MAKSKTKTYTTSDLAREFSISVVSASRFIQKHHFKPVKTGNHNAKYYSNSVYQEICASQLSKELSTLPKDSQKRILQMVELMIQQEKENRK